MTSQITWKGTGWQPLLANYVGSFSMLYPAVVSLLSKKYWCQSAHVTLSKRIGVALRKSSANIPAVP